jgi:hypothetical protein
MSARESSLECSICWAIFKNLHRSVKTWKYGWANWFESPLCSLKCGHSFCAGCLKEWFQSCWTLWLDGIPVHPIGTSRDISTLPLPPTVLSRVAARSGLPFTCPLCRDSLGLQPPCKVIAFSQLSDAISSNLGGAQGEDDPVTVWTGYFPWDCTQSSHKRTVTVCLYWGKQLNLGSADCVGRNLAWGKSVWGGSNVTLESTVSQL